LKQFWRTQRLKLTLVIDKDVSVELVGKGENFFLVQEIDVGPEK
jgi:hypothetical protein